MFISEQQGSWILSLFLIGDLIGGILNPFLIDRIGRKYTILAGVFLGLIGWIIIIIANSYIHLFTARFIGGIGQNIIYSSLIIYLAEISEKNIRGIFINLMKISENAGIFIFILISAEVSYTVLNWTTIILPIFFCIIFLFMPESPYYYFMKDEDEKAVKCLTKLRGHTTSEPLKSDILKIKLTIIEDKKNSKTALKDLLQKSFYRKGLMILLVSKLGQQLTGMNTIYGYAEQIYIDSNSPVNPKYSVLILTAFQLLAGLGSSFIIDKVSRRLLFLITGLLQSLSLGAITLFFILKSYSSVDVSSITWVPFTALILYEIVYAIGVCPITYILQGELFPMSVKGAAMALGVSIGSFFSFIGTIIYPIMKNRLGEYSPFLLYGIVSFISSLLTFWITPDTKGKTLEEIQEMENHDLKVKLDALSPKTIVEEPQFEI